MVVCIRVCLKWHSFVFTCIVEVMRSCHSVILEDYFLYNFCSEEVAKIIIPGDLLELQNETFPGDIK